MAARLRRFTMTVGGQPVAGARDFRYTDGSQWNNDRADNEEAGDFVRTGTGPYDVSFELLAPDGNVESGYVSGMVVTGKKISVSGGVESVTDVVLTFAEGYLNVGGDHNTDNPGRIPVTGQFKTLSIT